MQNNSKLEKRDQTRISKLTKANRIPFICFCFCFFFQINCSLQNLNENTGIKGHARYQPVQNFYMAKSNGLKVLGLDS